VTTLIVPGGGGFDFLVRLVKKGDTYGRNFYLVHNQDEPLVEFYDTRYPHIQSPGGQMLGQFVSRFTRSALDGSSEWSSGPEPSQEGLQLGGRHAPDWKIDAAGMRLVIAWLLSTKRVP